MTPATRDNWRKVKTALEAAGKTNCHMYQRACAAVKTGQDLGPPLFAPRTPEN